MRQSGQRALHLVGDVAHELGHRLGMIVGSASRSRTPTVALAVVARTAVRAAGIATRVAVLSPAAGPKAGSVTQPESVLPPPVVSSEPSPPFGWRVRRGERYSGSPSRPLHTLPRPLPTTGRGILTLIDGVGRVGAGGRRRWYDLRRTTSRLGSAASVSGSRLGALATARRPAGEAVPVGVEIRLVRGRTFFFFGNPGVRGLVRTVSGVRVRRFAPSASFTLDTVFVYGCFAVASGTPVATGPALTLHGSVVDRSLAPGSPATGLAGNGGIHGLGRLGGRSWIYRERRRDGLDRRLDVGLINLYLLTYRAAPFGLGIVQRPL